MTASRVTYKFLRLTLYQLTLDYADQVCGLSKRLRESERLAKCETATASLPSPVSRPRSPVSGPWSVPSPRSTMSRKVTQIARPS